MHIGRAFEHNTTKSLPNHHGIAEELYVVGVFRNGGNVTAVEYIT